VRGGWTALAGGRPNRQVRYRGDGHASGGMSVH